jgi:glutamyl-tRNA synthetase
MTTQNNALVRVRFAPSPTGHLHIGSLRTALFNWLFARHHNGTFLIRIEDTDRERSTKEFEQSLLQSLSWTGIASDELMLYQSQRFDLYRGVADTLLTEKKAYRCYCTQETLQIKRERAIAHQQTYQYDKSCRDLDANFEPKDKPHVIRFKVPMHDAQFVFDDLIKGQIAIPADQIDDFVILRSDGTVTYNFAVVVDDIASKISHIIRGEEHLFNTPKQMMLYYALSQPVPKFAHIPLILGPSGQKLSKRDGATSVVEYKNEGFLPHALCNYLVRLGWASGDQEIFTIQEMIEKFSLSGVHHAGAKFDMEKLKWMNAHYIKQLQPVEIIQLFLKQMDKDLAQKTADWADAQRLAWVALYQDRASTLLQLFDLVTQAYFLPIRYDYAALPESIAKNSNAVLKLLQQELVHADFEKEKLNAQIKQFCKAGAYKMADIAQLLRFVILGSVSGPSVFEMMVLLGSKEMQKRIAAALTQA